MDVWDARLVGLVDFENSSSNGSPAWKSEFPPYKLTPLEPASPKKTGELEFSPSVNSIASLMAADFLESQTFHFEPQFSYAPNCSRSTVIVQRAGLASRLGAVLQENHPVLVQ